MTELNTIQDNEATINITWQGQNGDFPDPVMFDAPDSEIIQWVTEAVRNGDVVGINTDPNANFTDFVVDRFAATEEVPQARIFVRPKTPFGLI